MHTYDQQSREFREGDANQSASVVRERQVQGVNARDRQGQAVIGAPSQAALSGRLLLSLVVSLCLSLSVSLHTRSHV